MEKPTQEQERVIFTIGGEKVDFTNFPPLTVGDKKKLKADPDYNVDFNKIRDLPPHDEAKLILFICRKVRPQTTMDEVDAMPVLASQKIIAHMVQASLQIDAPFSTPSTSSPAATAGGPTKS